MTDRPVQCIEQTYFNVDKNWQVPSVTSLTENASHDSFVIATSFIAMQTWKFARPWSRNSFNVSTYHQEMDKKILVASGIS